MVGSMFQFKAIRRPNSGIVVTRSNNTYGLIRKPKEPKIHECSPPGNLKRVLYFLIGLPIREGSLFRCSHCGKVYELNHSSNYIWNFWSSVSTYGNEHKQAWTGAGGKADEEETK